MTVFSFLHKKSLDAVIRPLTQDDRADLEKLIATDPVGFLHAAEHLEHFGLPSSSTLLALRAPQGFMGIFVAHPETAHAKGGGVEPRAARSLPNLVPAEMRQALGGATRRALARVGKSAGAHFADVSAGPGDTETLGTIPEEPRLAMVGAFWLGVNCVPLLVPDSYHEQVAHYIRRQHRKVASIFGRREAVMGVWKHLKASMPSPFDVREHQPLLYLSPEVSLETLTREWASQPLRGVPALRGEVRWAQPRDRVSLLKASVQMFREEVGYDPMERDAVGYTRRVDELTRQGRTVVAVNSAGSVVFKVDLGLVAGEHCQLQGVWLHPDYRGQGLSVPLLARTCELIRQRFPHMSLYVNDYNRPARALYEKTGWVQQGEFATVLF